MKPQITGEGGDGVTKQMHVPVSAIHRWEPDTQSTTRPHCRGGLSDFRGSESTGTCVSQAGEKSEGKGRRAQLYLQGGKRQVGIVE